jgi:hypothetical protein
MVKRFGCGVAFEDYPNDNLFHDGDGVDHVLVTFDTPELREIVAREDPSVPWIIDAFDPSNKKHMDTYNLLQEEENAKEGEVFSAILYAAIISPIIGVVFTPGWQELIAKKILFYASIGELYEDDKEDDKSCSAS